MGQPFDDQTNLLEFLEEACKSATSLVVVVAWAKRSGIQRVAEVLAKFRANGGKSRLIVGIDEGGATVQGLRMAIDVFDSVYILRDKRSRTFHPKIYLADADGSSFVFIGSNNLTAGGVFFNYEGALLLVLDLAKEADQRFHNEVTAYINRLQGDAAICIELSGKVLETLINDPRYRIGDEDRRRRLPTEAESVGDSDSDVDIAAETLFGTSTQKMKPDILRRAPAAAPAQARPTVAPAARPTVAPAAAPPAVPAVVERWSKQLTNSDAQSPNKGGSNPTGNMRLTQAGYKIDQTTYFRSSFFGNQAWTVRPGTAIVEARPSFEVKVDGAGLGSHQLRVSHDPSRVAAQNNAPTFLHWGDIVGARLKAKNYAGHYILLEKLSDGNYRLTITPNQP